MSNTYVKFCTGCSNYTSVVCCNFQNDKMFKKKVMQESDIVCDIK